MAIAALSLGLITIAASAQDTPGGSIRLITQDQAVNWQAGVDGNLSYTDDGYNFSGNQTGDGWLVQWDLLASSGDGQSILTNFTVINLGNETATFSLFASELLAAPYLSGTMSGGSVAGTYTDLNGDGVEIGAVGTNSIYSAFVDADSMDPFNGTVVASLLDGASGSASSFFSGTFAGESFGTSPQIPGEPGPAAVDNFGIMLEFTLSAGDMAGFTSSMAITAPAPGALALLTLGGLARRRRRTA